MTGTVNRPINVIAREISADWGAKLNYAAKPYLNAMYSVETPTDMYGADSGDTLIRYFLANAGTWRGETAKRVKAELKKMIGLK